MATQKILSWSISRLNCYSECPAKARFKFIDKKKEPGNQAMDRGSEIHAMAEKYLKAGGRLPKELKQFTEPFKLLRKLGALAEADFTFRSDWSATRWDDWNGAWCRAKADAVVPPKIIEGEPAEVRIIDFKTGKVKEDGEYDEQLELYGLAGLLTYPTADIATGELWFLDHGKTIGAQKEFTQKDVPKLKKAWELRVKKMLSDTQFKPTPGQACRWCHFSKAKDGPCKF